MEKDERSCFTETRKNCFMDYVYLLVSCLKHSDMGSGTKVNGLVQAPAVFPEGKKPRNTLNKRMSEP